MANMIGRYRSIAALGQGGMSEVFLTVSEGPFNFNKLLVVKQLKTDLAEDEQFRQMFLDEARLAARLNHPNVVQTYEVGAEGTRHFIAMEYIDGQALQSVLRRISRKTFPLGAHVTILSHVLSALAYVHDLRDFDGSPLSMVHRDVSPQNVIVTYEGQVKLVDFGVAKSSIAVAQTQAGILKGKAAYMAPEQISGKAIDGRADVFAVGVMLWEAIAGRRLVASERDATAVMMARMTGGESKVRDAAPHGPPKLLVACERALALAPEDRFADANAMRVALDEYLDETGLRMAPRELGALLREAFAAERASMDQKLSEQLKAPDAVDLDLSISLPRWGGSDSASAMESARSLDGSSGIASFVPVPAPNRWRWPVAFALVAVVALALAFVAGGRGEGSRSTASVAPPAPSTITTDTSPVGSGLRSPAAAPPSSSAMTALPAPSAPVAAERAAQPAVPAWAHASRPRDRGTPVDLSAESPKQRRPLDEKDPYE
jgi:eukaryotic-like serine/threonine-protein kinase